MGCVAPPVVLAECDITLQVFVTQVQVISHYVVFMIYKSWNNAKQFWFFLVPYWIHIKVTAIVSRARCNELLSLSGKALLALSDVTAEWVLLFPASINHNHDQINSPVCGSLSQSQIDHFLSLLKNSNWFYQCSSVEHVSFDGHVFILCYNDVWICWLFCLL